MEIQDMPVNMLHVLTSFCGSKHLIFKELSAHLHAAHYGQTRQHMLQHCYLYLGDSPAEVPTIVRQLLREFHR